MRLVVADTGPINYLILIGCVDLLPSLFETVLLPVAVAAELKAADAPTKVQEWIAKPPSWAEIRNDPPAFDPLLESLDAGEKAAIALARIGQADLLLMDERDGVKIARKQGLRVTGTLGVLDLAAERGLVGFCRGGSTTPTHHVPQAGSVVANTLKETLRQRRNDYQLKAVCKHSESQKGKTRVPSGKDHRLKAVD